MVGVAGVELDTAYGIQRLVDQTCVTLTLTAKILTHLSHLYRFLTLKNLASVFLQQGLEFYDNALHCYLQAVELDSNDSVVWNHLGTLSCSMGLLSVSRWAFEQGLLCSPNNCMIPVLLIIIYVQFIYRTYGTYTGFLFSYLCFCRELHGEIIGGAYSNS